MSKDNLESFQKKLQILRDTYVQQLPHKLSHIQSLWERIRSGKHTDTDIPELVRAVHSLAGSGTTFGFGEITDVAKELEGRVHMLSTAQGLQNMDASSISGHVDKLAGILLQASRADNDNNVLPREITPQKNSHEVTELNNRVYIIEDDEGECGYIANLLGEHGFPAETFSTIDALIQRAIAAPPAIVITDIILNDNDKGGIELANELQDNSVMCPIIAVTVKDEVDTRIQACNAGIKHYLTKPLDTISFINTVTDIIHTEKESPYRVLIVDDDRALAEYYALSLEKSGMKTQILSSPHHLIKIMDTYRPEIILMDILMPDYSGTDLASVIRQNRKYDNVPIVFLSSETDFWKKTSALNMGGDDFITKPIMPEHLAITVLARVKRARQLSNSRHMLENAISELERYKLGLDEHAIVSISDVDGGIIYANSKFQRLAGYSLEELIGQNHSIVNSGYHSKEFFADMWSTITHGKVWQGIIRNRRRDGDNYWVETTIVPYLDKYGIPYQYMAIRTDITEQVNAKEQAEQANRAKSDFLSSMSHELRTPLNAILGFSHLLEMDENTPLTDAQIENVIEIRKAGDHLLYLINEILDLSKIEAGKMDISTDPVNINELVNECRDLVVPISSSKKVSINCTLDISRDKHVLGDRARIKQCLLNLLSNAVKYNKVGGHVDITSDLTQDGHIRLSVTDTGKGISNDMIDQLFVPFNRLGLKSTESEGTGIGLVITKRLIEMMGGEIGVETGTGGGSTFWIQLLATDHRSSNTVDGLDSFHAVKPEVQRQHSLLYIEDNSSNVKLVEKLIGKRNDITMCAAYLPHEGLDMADRILPDIILLDINLPGMDGYEVLKMLKNNAKTRHIPVIALSANAMPSDVKTGIDAGFNYYLTKPVNVRQFFSTLDTVIAELQHQTQQ